MPLPILNRRAARAVARFLFVLTLCAATSAVAQLHEEDGFTETYIYYPEDALAEFTVGVFMLESGEVSRAVNHLEYAWRRSRQEARVGRRLAEAFFVLRDYDRSKAVISEILAERPSDYESLLLKAKIEYLQRDPGAATKTLEGMRHVHGSVFEVEKLLGSIYYEMERFDRAREAYGRCITIDGSYPYILFRYGLLAADAGETAEAEDALQRALELDPGFSEAATELAELYLREGRAADAVPLLERTIDATASNSATLTLAQIYFEAGRYDEGIQLLEKRRATGQLSSEGEILRGRFYLEAGDYDEAFDIFARMFKGAAETPELARILGEIAIRSGDTETARDYFEKAIKLDPVDYRSYLGMFFAATDNPEGGDAHVVLTHDEIVSLLDKAAGLVEGHDFEGQYLLGVSYLSIDSLDVARRHLMRADVIREDDRSTLLNLATIHEKLGDLAGAERYVIRLYQLDPEDPVTCNFYGYLLAERGKDLAKAENLVRKALEIDPENGYYLDSLGWIYYQRGDYSRAVVELEKAIALAKDDPVILEHLGDAYRAMNRVDEARSAYEQSSRLLEENSHLLEKIEATGEDVH